MSAATIDSNATLEGEASSSSLQIANATLPVSISVPSSNGTTKDKSNCKPKTKKKKKRASTMASTSVGSWCRPLVESIQQPQQDEHSAQITLTSSQQSIARDILAMAPIIEAPSTSTYSTSTNTTMMALVGPRGRGKARIASYVMQQHQQQQKQQQHQVLWLQAHSEDTLRASYLDVLRHYAPKSSSSITAATSNAATSANKTTPTTRTLLTLAKAILNEVLNSNYKSPCWWIVYENVGVSPSVFFSQWAIPTTQYPTMLTSNRTEYATWQLPKYDSRLVPAMTGDESAALLLLQDDNSQQQQESLQTLAYLLQHLPLALFLASAQWRHNPLDVSLDVYIQQLQDYRTEYLQQTPSLDNKDDETSLDWFWSFSVAQVLPLTAENSTSEQQQHQDVLLAVSMFHHTLLPAALFKSWETVLPKLQQWNILRKHHLLPNATTTVDDATVTTQHYYYSIPLDLQQAIRRRFSPTEALPMAIHALLDGWDDAPSQHVSLLPHIQAVVANVDLLLLTKPNDLPSDDFPRNDYARLLLEAGVVWQKQQQQPSWSDGTSQAQTYFHKGLAMVNDQKNCNSSTTVERLLDYRLGTIARAQGDLAQAKHHSLQALEGYGYVNTETTTLNDHTSRTTTPATTGADIHNFVDMVIRNHSNASQGNLNNNNTKSIHKEWNILSQLFHTCGHESWQSSYFYQARTYFEYELAIKQAWYGKDQPHVRLARTLNNLGSVCRDEGDLEAARNYSQLSLDMQVALHDGSDNNDGELSNLEAATTLNNLGSLSYSLCSFQEAQQFLERALAMKLACYKQQQENDSDAPIRNLDVGETYYNLGMLQDHFSSFDKAEEYYLKSLECKHAVYGNDAQNAELATTLSSLGLSTMNHGRYQQSETYYKQALDMQQNFYKGTGTMETVRTLHGLGILNYHLQRIERSRQYHRQALEMQQEIEALERSQSHSRATSLTDPRTANLSQVLQSLGNLSHNVGSYKEAGEFYEQGLKLYAQVSTDQAKYVLSNLQDLTSTASYDAARNYYEKALTMKYSIYGEDAKNSDLAFTLRSLALLNDNSSNTKAAEECYLKSLDMLHHIYGSEGAENTEIAGVLDGLGTVKFNQGQCEDSQSYMRRSLVMKENVYGGPEAMNGDLATSHVSLGALAHTMGDYDSARQHLETALEMQQQVYGAIQAGDQNIELGVTANCLANLYRDLGETEKALALYQMSVNYMGKDAENPYLASVLTDFGEHYRLLGDLDNASACLNQALSIQNNLYGIRTENAETAFTLTNLGKVLTDQGKFEEAQECFQRALKMQQTIFKNQEGDGDDAAHRDIAETLQALGNLLRHQGDLESSKAHLERAKEMREKMYGDAQSIEMARNVASLGIVYSELNEEEKAKSCHDKLTSLRKVIPGLFLDEFSEFSMQESFVAVMDPSSRKEDTSNIRKTDSSVGSTGLDDQNTASDADEIIGESSLASLLRIAPENVVLEVGETNSASTKDDQQTRAISLEPQNGNLSSSNDSKEEPDILETGRAVFEGRLDDEISAPTTDLPSPKTPAADEELVKTLQHVSEPTHDDDDDSPSIACQPETELQISLPLEGNAIRSPMNNKAKESDHEMYTPVDPACISSSTVGPTDQNALNKSSDARGAQPVIQGKACVEDQSKMVESVTSAENDTTNEEPTEGVPPFAEACNSPPAGVTCTMVVLVASAGSDTPGEEPTEAAPLIEPGNSSPAGEQSNVVVASAQSDTKDVEPGKNVSLTLTKKSPREDHPIKPDEREEIADQEGKDNLELEPGNGADCTPSLTVNSAKDVVDASKNLNKDPNSHQNNPLETTLSATPIDENNRPGKIVDSKVTLVSIKIRDEGAPEMDWTDKKVVKRESRRFLLGKKLKEKSGNDRTEKRRSSKAKLAKEVDEKGSSKLDKTTKGSNSELGKQSLSKSQLIALDGEGNDLVAKSEEAARKAATERNENCAGKNEERAAEIQLDNSVSSVDESTPQTEVVEGSKSATGSLVVDNNSLVSGDGSAVDPGILCGKPKIGVEGNTGVASCVVETKGSEETKIGEANPAMAIKSSAVEDEEEKEGAGGVQHKSPSNQDPETEDGIETGTSTETDLSSLGDVSDTNDTNDQSFSQFSGQPSGESSTQESLLLDRAPDVSTNTPEKVLGAKSDTCMPPNPARESSSSRDISKKKKVLGTKAGRTSKTSRLGRALAEEEEKKKVASTMAEKGEKEKKSASTSRALPKSNDQSGKPGRDRSISKHEGGGRVTDMAPREAEVVRTTCGCWPFGR